MSMKGNLPPRFVDSATSVGTSSVKISKYFSDKFGTQASCKGKTKTRLYYPDSIFISLELLMSLASHSHTNKKMEVIISKCQVAVLMIFILFYFTFNDIDKIEQ